MGGDDVAVGADDDAGAERALARHLRLLLLRLAPAEEVAQAGVVEERVLARRARDFLGADGDDGRRDASDHVGVGVVLDVGRRRRRQLEVTLPLRLLRRLLLLLRRPAAPRERE